MKNGGVAELAEGGGLENRLARKGHGGSNPSSSASKLKATLKLRRFFFRSKMTNACLFYPNFIPTVSKTVRPERTAVWKTALPVRAGANVNEYSVQSRILRATMVGIPKN